MNWIIDNGRWEFNDASIKYLGGYTIKDTTIDSGIAYSDIHSGSGEIRCKITFSQIEENQSVSIVTYRHPETGNFLAVQIGGAFLVSVYTYVPTPSTTGSSPITFYANAGDGLQIHPGVPYEISIRTTASVMTVSVNGVVVKAVTFTFDIPSGQTGIQVNSKSPVSIDDFSVDSTQPDMFVVMEYSDDYNALYEEVIKPIGQNFGYHVVRADEMTSNGMIINDITQQIDKSSVIVAEITPDNPNVYWELGYAHAKNKNVVLLANKNRRLPFDVSGLRVVVYENSIAGRSQLESRLTGHLEAVNTAVIR